MDRARSSILMIAVGALALLSVVAVDGRKQWPAPDRGAAGVWQKLRKLQTTASAMHTTAHPDDEHGGMLAMLSRGLGARVSLLTLTRGESGDNAIGAELFDALGLIRTEELLVADRYYGVDEQYFTSVADYGFSKRLDEALEKWGREHVLRDMVRIIRTDRPMVVISRFQGNPRDGHGNHEAAGLLTRDAFRMAGDPKAFADQIGGGLRPWQPLKLYMGGVRENENWNVRLDTGTYDPVLGESYQTLARLGLSFQRSQNSGRFVAQPGPSVSFYRRLEMAPRIEAPDREQSFFDGIDTTIPGLYRALGHTPPPVVARALAAVDASVKDAIAAFTLTDPSATVPALATALAAVTTAIAQENEHLDVKAALVVKKRQIAEAIHAALGVSLTGMAQPEGSSQAGPFGAGAVPMPPVVPGSHSTCGRRSSIPARSSSHACTSSLKESSKESSKGTTSASPAVHRRRWMPAAISRSCRRSPRRSEMRISRGRIFRGPRFRTPDTRLPIPRPCRYRRCRQRSKSLRATRWRECRRRSAGR